MLRCLINKSVYNQVSMVNVNDRLFLASIGSRFSSQPSGGSVEKELESKLKKAFNTDVAICKDISGGCGSMYNIHIESAMFSGVSKVQATRMVNKILADDIKNWHGMTLTTSSPESNNKNKT